MLHRWDILKEKKKEFQEEMLMILGQRQIAHFWAVNIPALLILKHLSKVYNGRKEKAYRK